MDLDDATRALRERGKLSEERKRALRARIVARPSPSKKIIAWTFPIAAVLAATSVWASATGRWFARDAKPSTTPQTVMTEVVRVPPPVETNEAPVVPAPVVTAPPKVSASAVSPKELEGVDPSLRAFREAERAQRVDKDFGRAVTLWDAYLARAGASPLAVDARYNRALCLLRLGRRDEARLALEPFARGESGSYRQSEAKSLLDEMSEQ